jgi:ubiquinone/menaquinone biosynthesis C-methylase UbiE
MQNKDILNNKVIKDFGSEWKNFDQSKLTENELINNFNQYFSVFPLHELDKKKEGFDLGCGSGRWAKLIAPRVKKLNCIEPSLEAIKVAKKNLDNNLNVIYYNSDFQNTNINENSQDFGYCLGVLHHTTEIKKGLNFCNKILKKDSPFLIYLYYSLDNRPFYYKIIWKISNFLRFFISILPFPIKKVVTNLIAVFIYFPTVKLVKFLDLLGLNTNNFPLSYYKDKSFYTMRTDSLDRFGTKLENRYTQIEIKEMLEKSGFKDIKFSNRMPFWVAVCRKI